MLAYSRRSGDCLWSRSVARWGEASDEERSRFANALAPYLEDRNAVSELANLLGVNRNAVYQWRSAQREPSRRQVFAIERALGLPPGALSHLLGYLPVTAWAVEEAVYADGSLSDVGKGAMMRLYRSLVEEGP